MIHLHRILVPTDFSEYARPAIRYAAELAQKFSAELILLHVVPDTILALPDAVMPTPAPLADLEAMVASGKQGLANVIASEHLTHLHPRAEVRIGSPAAEIIAAANDLKADLICIGTHGRTGLLRVLLGSVAEMVVRQAPCPVLTVRPPVAAA
ncbi:MAG: universal stress protein [Gemmataceae bacterium]|nr:universal stress protein [Gemmata sp.]MDW8198361.1 universal stress protein [Gemmataceae bacterium]